MEGRVTSAEASPSRTLSSFVGGNASPTQHASVLPDRSNRHRHTTRAVIAKIEDIFASLVDCLTDLRVMTIPIRSRSTGRDLITQFPASTEAERKRFTAILLILHLSHENLVAGTVITKRAIYYQNTDLFGSQRYVDNLVNDIAFSFQIGRDDLNIVASSKGLIAGPIILTMENGPIFDCNMDSGQGVLLPEGSISRYDLRTSRWILIIEKEATFRGLVNSRFHERTPSGPGILITAKGYPDLATRQLLHAIATNFPMLPVLALVDFNPHGMRIMLTYKNGSESLRHEADVTTDRLNWIGPKSSDVLNHPEHGRSLSTLSEAHASNLWPGASAPMHPGNMSPFENTLPLSNNDRKLAIGLLDTLLHSEDPESVEMNAGSADHVRELQIMLFLNFKAEIQAVDEAGDLTRWLDRALLEELHPM
ncbi:DNA topoisomerase IV, alpha subunit [Xylariaceae sp. FL0594]|nr:DNA topoisomerase IV, alpha subunit [Xylariaceae sp. FL0594]